MAMIKLATKDQKNSNFSPPFCHTARTLLYCFSFCYHPTINFYETMLDNEKVNESLNEGCKESLDLMKKLDIETFAEVQAKLEWVIGSYAYDKNPVGLNEIGIKALEMLKEQKQQKGYKTKVTKKVLDKLEKAIEKYADTYVKA